nr:MFS transporter [Nostoc sp. ChiSLP01]
LTSPAVCAWWADRSTSRQGPLLLGLVGLLGSTIILCLARSIRSLIIGRVLQGLSGAVSWTVPLAIVTDRVDPTQIGKYLGYLNLARTAGMAVGPVLGGTIFDELGYSGVYWTAIIFLGIDVLLRLSLIHHCPTPDKTETPMGMDRPVCVRKGTWLQCPRIVRMLLLPRLSVAICGSFVSAWICGGLDATLPLYVSQVFEWNSGQAGAALLGFLCPFLFSPLFGYLYDRTGAKWFASAGYAFCGITLACLAVVKQNTVLNQVLLMLLLIFTGTFNAMFEVPLWADAVGAISDEAASTAGLPQRGLVAQVYGFTNVMFALGFVIGPLFGAFIYQRCGWAAFTLVLGAIPTASALPTFLWTGNDGSRKNRPRDEA